MALRFFDRKGKKLTRDEWWALFRKPLSTCLARTERGGVVLEACWVGVATDRESVPLTFLVHAYRTFAKGNIRTEVGKCVWLPTEALALEAFKRREQELFKR